MLAATAAGLSVRHGTVWIVSAISLLVVVLVGRTLALWTLIGDFDLAHDAIDTWSDIVDGLEGDQRHRSD